MLSLVMRVSVGLGLDVGACDTVGMALGLVVGEEIGARDTVGIELDGEELGAGVVLGDTLGATDEDDSNFRLLSLLRSCPKTRNGLKTPPLNATLLLSNESTTAM